VKVSPTQLTDASDRVLNVQAVIFDDDLRIGAFPQAQFLRLRRIGRMLEIERINNMLASSDVPETLAAGVGELPASSSAALASLADVPLPGISINDFKHEAEQALIGFLEGVRNSREEAQFLMKQLRTFHQPRGQAVRLSV
jgi:hypothetical protein